MELANSLRQSGIERAIGDENFPMGPVVYNENFMLWCDFNRPLVNKIFEKTGRQMNFTEINKWIKEHPTEYKNIANEVMERYHIKDLSKDFEKYYNEANPVQLRNMQRHLRRAHETASNIKNEANKLAEKADTLMNEGELPKSTGEEAAKQTPEGPPSEMKGDAFNINDLDLGEILGIKGIELNEEFFKQWENTGKLPVDEEFFKQWENTGELPGEIP